MTVAERVRRAIPGTTPSKGAGFAHSVFFCGPEGKPEPYALGSPNVRTWTHLSHDQAAEKCPLGAGRLSISAIVGVHSGRRLRAIVECIVNQRNAQWVVVAGVVYPRKDTV